MAHILEGGARKEAALCFPPRPAWTGKQSSAGADNQPPKMTSPLHKLPLIHQPRSALTPCDSRLGCRHSIPNGGLGNCRHSAGADNCGQSREPKHHTLGHGPVAWHPLESPLPPLKSRWSLVSTGLSPSQAPLNLHLVNLCFVFLVLCGHSAGRRPEKGSATGGASRVPDSLPALQCSQGMSRPRRHLPSAPWAVPDETAFPQSPSVRRLSCRCSC